MTAPLITESFGRRYRRDRPWALRDLSINVPHESITALVGPNGSGKSTLIRACLGFESANAGRILVFGNDPQRNRMKVIETIAYIPQAASLYRNLTIADHLTIAAAARKSFDRTYALTRIEAAGLMASRKLGELSGGEQAQVALALALGTHAPLLLLDEPLASLDPLARRDFLAAMTLDVRNRGITAVISSHLVADIEHICDRLIVLAGGGLVLESNVSEARERFSVVAAADVSVTNLVGIFSGPTGERLALADGGKAGRSATLEEIVLGHLAAGRALQPEARS